MLDRIVERLKPALKEPLGRTGGRGNEGLRCLFEMKMERICRRTIAGTTAPTIAIVDWIFIPAFLKFATVRQSSRRDSRIANGGNTTGRDLVGPEAGEKGEEEVKGAE